jgi:hypothetical protein
LPAQIPQRLKILESDVQGHQLQSHLLWKKEGEIRVVWKWKTEKGQRERERKNGEGKDKEGKQSTNKSLLSLAKGPG